MATPPVDAGEAELALVFETFTATLTAAKTVLDAYARLARPSKELGAEVVARLWPVAQLRTWSTSVVSTLEDGPLLARRVALAAWSDAHLVAFAEHTARSFMAAWPRVAWRRDVYGAILTELAQRPTIVRPPSVELYARWLESAPADGALDFSILLDAPHPGIGREPPARVKWLAAPDALRDAIHATVALAGCNAPHGRLAAFAPFAEGPAYVVFALDLRGGGNGVPVVSFKRRFSVALGHYVEGPLKKVAASFDTWLSRTSDKARKKAAPRQGAPEALTASEDEELAVLARVIADRGIAARPRATQKIIEDFEARACVALPAAYRELLLRIGNGVGQLAALPAPEARPRLAEPFPCREETPTLSDDDSSRLGDGVLRLVDSYFLVVTGASRGQVWTIGEEVVRPLAGFLAWARVWFESDDPDEALAALVR